MKPCNTADQLSCYWCASRHSVHLRTLTVKPKSLQVAMTYSVFGNMEIRLASMTYFNLGRLTKCNFKKKINDELLVSWLLGVSLGPSTNIVILSQAVKHCVKCQVGHGEV